VWRQDDGIGVFCVEPGKSLGKVNLASNKKYVYNYGKFEAASEADKIWISRDGTFKFYAYYPYITSKTGV
ncbi:fimbrillin family protein, partial [Parabacteroides merdae]|uniref:fimbrillin family protein n=1 Tax=Parabacteroides merdae TaxID=46503 RepID=UPI00210C8A8B